MAIFQKRSRGPGQKLEKWQKLESKGNARGLWQIARQIDSPTAASAKFALVRIGEPAVPTLLTALLTEPERIQARAERILELIGEPAVPTLIQALQHNDPHLRARAAAILGLIQDGSAEEALRGALEDADAEVQKWARWALSYFKGGAADVQRLTYDLIRPDLVDRLAAVQALGNTGSEEAIQPLLNLFGLRGSGRIHRGSGRIHTDSNEAVLKAAIIALGEVGDESVIQQLKPFLEGKVEELLWLDYGRYLNSGPADPRLVEALLKRGSVESAYRVILEFPERANLIKGESGSYEISDGWNRYRLEQTEYAVTEVPEQYDPDFKPHGGLAVYRVRDDMTRLADKVLKSISSRKPESEATPAPEVAQEELSKEEIEETVRENRWKIEASFGMGIEVTVAGNRLRGMEDWEGIQDELAPGERVEVQFRRGHGKYSKWTNHLILCVGPLD